MRRSSSRASEEGGGAAWRCAGEGAPGAGAGSPGPGMGLGGAHAMSGGRERRWTHHSGSALAL